MKVCRSTLIIGVVAIATVALCAVSCGSTADTTWPELQTTTTIKSTMPVTSPSTELSGTALDFFPHEVGMTWSWEIVEEETMPAQNWVINWPVVNQGMWGRKLVNILYGAPTILTLKVIDICNDIQTGEETLSGVELQIVRDDAGVYQNAKQLFWAFVPGDELLVLEVVYLPGSFAEPWPDSDQAVQSDHGVAVRPIFFDGSVALSNNYTFAWNAERAADDVLHFSDLTGDSCTFVRRVAAEAPYDHVLKRAFNDTITYKQGIGLWSLDQEVEGMPSMSWKLVDFSL